MADKTRRLAALPEACAKRHRTFGLVTSRYVGDGRGSAANLTNVLFLDKNLFYGVLGPRPRANREAGGTHMHEDPFWIFGLPTYSTYEVGTIVPYRGS